MAPKVSVGLHTMVPASLHTLTLISNEQAAENTYRLVVYAPQLACSLQPGQFINLAVPGDPRHLLRLPFAYARTHRQEGTLELIYTVVGEGTMRLSRMDSGDKTDCIGPCGKGWRLDEVPRLDEGCNRYLIVGGGAGLAPAISACEVLVEAGVACDVVVGAQTKRRVLMGEVRALRDLLAPVGGTLVVTTDDGSFGIAGFAQTGVEFLLSLYASPAHSGYRTILACGPMPMMKSVAALAQNNNIRCQVSLEAMMGCGFGACSCCNIARAAGGYASCCKDGPVFDAEEVAWL